MFKKPFHIILLSCFLVCMCACNKKKQAGYIDEKVTLSATDKRPFGAYTFRYLADLSFVDSEISNNSKPFDKWHNEFLLYNEDRTDNVYMLTTPALYCYKDEVLAMADFVERGNTLFIAANYFDPHFLETFSLNLQNDLSLLSPPTAFDVRTTKKELTDTNSFKPSAFGFTFYPLQRSMTIDSTKQYEVIGHNDFEHPDLLRIQYGKGQLIVMANVVGLSNYFLLSHDNYKYALGALSYLPVYNNSVTWDDFYRRNSQANSRPKEGQTMFGALLSIPQMRWALWILVGTIVIWFVTNLFRKQRIIPVQKSNSNSSIEFTQTIARLYFNKKDNHNIALKMIAYFQDHLRSKYYMNYTGINEEFARTLAAKTGLSPEKTAALVHSIYTVQHNGTTSDSTLLLLNKQIQEVLNSTHRKS